MKFLGTLAVAAALLMCAAEIRWGAISAWAGDGGEVKAAWAQAMLSVVAILASSWIWRKEQKAKRADASADMLRQNYREAVRLSGIFAEVGSLLPNIERDISDISGTYLQPDRHGELLRLELLKELADSCGKTRGGTQGFECAVLQTGATAARVVSVIRHNLSRGGRDASTGGLPHSEMFILSPPGAAVAIELVKALADMVKRSREDMEQTMKNPPNWS